MFGQIFGVEIELNGCFPEKLRSKLRGKGARQTSKGMTLPGCPGFYFKVGYDGSVDGSEIKTSKMTEKQIPYLTKLLKLLSECGMRTGRNCGIHIHVGLDEWTSWTKWLVLRERAKSNWNLIKDQVWNSFQPHEYRTRYCKKSWYSRDEVVDNRYQAVNLTRQNHPTVEFRLFNTTLDPQKLQKAIHFACGFMALTKMDKPAPKTKASYSKMMDQWLKECAA